MPLDSQDNSDDAGSLMIRSHDISRHQKFEDFPQFIRFLLSFVLNAILELPTRLFICS
ncbi:hypothetical protein DL98DRAFT_252304 [Cadophora sp. DSE1049]|nr:hypothetical protein DL98DRAFT_252304 [Cadophora sp. DSE1049]